MATDPRCRQPHCENDHREKDQWPVVAQRVFEVSGGVVGRIDQADDLCDRNRADQERGHHRNERNEQAADGPWHSDRDVTTRHGRPRYALGVLVARAG